MARPKKIDAEADAIFSLKTTELLWMRDKFISGLSNLESGVHELRRAYISHFNTLLPDNHPGRLSLPFFTSFDNAAAGPLGNVPADPTAVAAVAHHVTNAVGAAPAVLVANSDAALKKKRKPHDPNAPKRALTSYFLFMQHNKPAIKEEHPDWAAAQVAEESERRWNNISEEEKTRYEYMYQVDLARYYKQKEAYEAGEAVPEIDAEMAQRLYEEHVASGLPFKGRKGRKLDGVAAPEVTAVPIAVPVVAASESEEEEEAAPPPPKSNKRQKTEPKAAGKGSAQAKKFKEVIPPKSPEVPKKKGGRKSKAAEESPAVEEPTPKKEKKGRKRKSAAAE